jgi:hypothetical protein
MEAYELNRAIEKSNGGKHRAVTPPPIDDVPLDADGFPIITPPSESSRNSQVQHGGLGYSSFPDNTDRDMLDPYEYGKDPFADDNGEGSSRAYAYDDDEEPRPRIDKGKGRAVDSDDGRDLSPIDTTGINGSSRARADTVDSVVSPVTPRDYVCDSQSSHSHDLLINLFTERTFLASHANVNGRSVTRGIIVSTSTSSSKTNQLPFFVLFISSSSTFTSSSSTKEGRTPLSIRLGSTQSWICDIK